MKEEKDLFSPKLHLSPITEKAVTLKKTTLKSENIICI